MTINYTYIAIGGGLLVIAVTLWFIFYKRKKLEKAPDELPKLTPIPSVPQLVSEGDIDSAIKLELKKTDNRLKEIQKTALDLKKEKDSLLAKKGKMERYNAV